MWIITFKTFIQNGILHEMYVNCKIHVTNAKNTLHVFHDHFQSNGQL